MTNPLLDDWTDPFGVPPFNRIEDADFEPALAEALTRARAEIDAIAASEAEPDFANTLEALEQVGEALDKVLTPFYVLAATDSTPERQALQRKFAPLVSDFSAEVMMNPALFARIDRLWRKRDRLALSDEQLRLLEIKHRDFRRAGAELDGAPARRLREIKQRLAILGTDFTQNLLADEDGWSMPLSEDDLGGLPEFLREAAAGAAREKGRDGYLITLSRSLIVPFLQFSSRRDLRERAYEAWQARGANGGSTDNRAIAAEMLALRHERAALLGHEDFASYKLEPEMAGTPGAVRDLLMAVWSPARARAEADARLLEDMMHEDGINGRLEPWDWRYYAARRRASQHRIDEAEVKSFFRLEAMIEAAFDCASRLFGLEFRPLELPLNHPDARAWEVTRDGAHVAVFVGDYFARAGKRSGAWCSAWRAQEKLRGERRPIVHNVCNFAKPPAGAPALLSYDDARTLFHEFGHALHQMLSDVTYPSLSGTSVSRDFVELPSQLFEHWLSVPEVLQTYARHVRTGEAMPQALLERLLAAQNSDTGFETVEYLASALVDLAFHEGPPPADPMGRQAEVLAALGMPHAIRMRHATPQFAHVFSGDGYAAGYYSYMWSEVMDADAFEAFTEAGDAFDPATARRLEDEILSVGGSREAEEAYKGFRGRMPGVGPLLAGRGLA